MTIRTRLALTMASLVAVSTALLGAGVVLVSSRFSDRDAQRRLRTMESYVEKAARDALIQKDDLTLVSYITFLRTQYPSLTRARLKWQTTGTPRELTIGQDPAPDRPHDARALSIVDPSDPKRRVDVTLDVDPRTLREVVGNDARRLIKIIVAVGFFTLLGSVVLSVWLSHTVTAPMQRLDRLASEIASGKLGASLDWKSEDELGHLVKSFNTMSRKLEELDETKKNFVSSVTHELRSPLGAIESFLVLIDGKISAAAGTDAAQCRDYLSRVRLNVQRLSRFINDLLDVAKIEKGKMECTLKPASLEAIVGEVCQFFGPKAQQQGVALTHQLKGLPSVMADADRLRQVFVNLVSNALKFTNEGGRVTISAEQFREDGHRWVEVAVRDTGRGMEERDLALLFQAFSQGRNGVEREVGSTNGTGLGLYITKSIVEQHGGKIGVTSAPGRGTAVSFSLVVA